MSIEGGLGTEQQSASDGWSHMLDGNGWMQMSWMVYSAKPLKRGVSPGVIAEFRRLRASNSYLGAYLTNQEKKPQILVNLLTGKIRPKFDVFGSGRSIGQQAGRFLNLGTEMSPYP